MSKGNFHLAEWISNSSILNSLINKYQLNYSGSANAVKILGLLWNLASESQFNDHISIKCKC